VGGEKDGDAALTQVVDELVDVFGRGGVEA